MSIQIGLTVAEALLLKPMLESSLEMDSGDPEIAPFRAALNWESMLDKLNKEMERMSNENKMSKSVEEIEEMFETCLTEVDGHAVGFIESLYEQWEEKQFLTEKQIESLEKFYERCGEDSDMD